MIEEMKRERVEFICHAGDITDGLSRRRNHVYELTHIAYNDQRKYAIEMLGMWKGKWYLIDGNHDRWWIDRGGVKIGEDIDKALPNAEFLGHDQADITLKVNKGRAVVRLFHGADGNTYAKSYRLQKLCESFRGGQKPNVLLAGHTHKQMQMIERNIFVYSGGCMSEQSNWMRSKKIPAEPGFWIIELTIDKNGVAKNTSTFYPFY